MIDSYGRKIEYLRLSVTERCQQKCSYCSKAVGGICVKDNELSCKDFVLIAKACADLGFKKIRFTGGEPLLRHDLSEIISGVSSLNSYEDIALTTNARMLSQQAAELKKAGLMRCNISLDSLNDETYKKITGCELAPTLDGIRAAYDNRLLPLKINCVLIKGVNDGEIDDFINLAKQYPIDIRFIELMPMGDGGEGVKSADILASHGYLTACENRISGEPAAYYSAESFKGRVGFISPISQSFCGECNRLRITSDGTSRPCLGANIEFSLREAVEKNDIDEIKKAIAYSISQKPSRNNFGCTFRPSRKMNRIGG